MFDFSFNRKTTSPSLQRKLAEAFERAMPGGASISYRHTQASGFNTSLGVLGGPGSGIGQNDEVSETPEWIKLPAFDVPPLPDAPDNVVDVPLASDDACACSGRIGVRRNGKVKTLGFLIANDGTSPRFSRSNTATSPSANNDETEVSLAVLIDAGELVLRVTNNAALHTARVLLLYEVETFA